MGESITEGTIVRWMKRVGDTVDKDEPLFEISTDKVDAEIPSPDAGVLSQILVREGDTVPVHTVVAIINTGAATRLGIAVGFFRDDVVAESDALVADVDRGASDELLHFLLRFSAEGAAQITV